MLNIIFAGTPDFALPALQKLIDAGYNIAAVYTQPDRPAGRGQHLHQSPVKQLALKYQLPVFQPESLKKPEAQEILKQFAPDVIIVAAYGMILPRAVLDIPRYGCINIHPSLLPRWRGAAPIQRPILAGDTETGVTIMQMNEGLDTGDMLYQVRCPLGAEDTAKTLHDYLATLGADALLATLEKLPQGLLKPIKQDDKLATYAAKFSKEDARLDWSLPAQVLDRMIRAFNPLPGAYTYLEKQLIKIGQAIPVKADTKKYSPGEIIFSDISEGHIDVATGDSILRLLRMQLSGGKMLAVKDILNSRASFFAPGEIFNHA